MNNVKVDVNIKLLSPLSHFGDERMGTMQLMRTHKLRSGNEFIDIPCFSGNAFRGIFRRRIMRDYLERIGTAEEGISKNLYYMLFTGGALTSGARYEEVGERKKIRKMCPPLALLGTAIGSQIPQGKMKSSIFLPICKETVDYTGIEENISFYDMLEDIFYTRKDDLKSVEANIKEMENEKENANPTQMKYEMQCLAAGTKMNGQILIENANEIEESCLHAGLELIEEVPYIGGKSSAGHGKIEMSYTDLADTQIYYDYLEECKEEMKEWIREVEKELK